MFLRILMLPLIGGGAYFFYLFAMTIKDVMTDIATERESVAGQILCVLFALVLALPGLMGLLSRSSLVFDKERARVTKIQRFGPFELSKAIPFSAIRMVSLTSVEVSDTSMLYSVSLMRGRGGEAITAALSQSPQEAEITARNLASFLAVPFGDFRGSEPEEG